ncbi:MAG: DUF423 domain-containing protein [Sphingomonadales bacterium]
MKLWGPTGAVLGLAAVALGAAGSHAVPMDDYRTSLFETASRYHFYHALALIAVGLAIGHARAMWAHFAGMAFLFGTVMFCGSLYLRAFGLMTPSFMAPVGGTALMAGWLLLAIAIFLGRRRP